MTGTPLVGGIAAFRIRREKDAGGYDDIVDAAVGEQGLIEHRLNIISIGDIHRKGDGGTAARDPAAGDANPLSVDIG